MFRALLLVTLFALQAHAAAPLPLVFAESIAGLKPGMTRAQVLKLGHRLEPEGIDRAERTGFFSGPMLLLFDAHDTLVLISVDLHKSAGLQFGKKHLPPRATLQQLSEILPGCKLERGSGGNALSCADAQGRLLNAYDDFGAQVWVQLGPG